MTKKHRKPKDTEGKILWAAERIFAEKGLKGARTSEIAELAEVTPSLINYHFGSKEKLYQTVIENYYLNVERRLFPILMEDISPAEKLKKFLLIGIDIMAEKDHVARILLRESLDNGSFVNEVFSKPYLREMFEMTERCVFSKMKRRGSHGNDSMHLMCSLFGIVTIFFIEASTIKEFWKKNVFSKKMIEERKAEVIDFVFNGVGHCFE